MPAPESQPKTNGTQGSSRQMRAKRLRSTLKRLRMDSSSMVIRMSFATLDLPQNPLDTLPPQTQRTKPLKPLGQKGIVLPPGLFRRDLGGRIVQTNLAAPPHDVGQPRRKDVPQLLNLVTHFGKKPSAPT